MKHGQTTRIFTGLELAEQINGDTARRAAGLARRPRCAVLLDAADPAMRAYAERQRAVADRAGIELHLEPYADTAAAVRSQLQRLAADALTDAVMTLYPLPAGVDALEAALLIGPDKDVDGLHPLNAGLLALGAVARAPATATACRLCAGEILGSLRGAEIVIVGASRIVGRPLANLFLDAQATVTLCHVDTRDLAAHTRDADLVVSAAGVPGLIGAEHIRAGAVVIDVSIIRTPDGLVGDVDRAAVTGKAACITHVPDGVGPVTTASLFRNVVDAVIARTGSAG